MPRKHFRIQCDPEVAELLARQILFYTSAAYPPGGSDCAQAAREAMLGAADTIRNDVASSGSASASVRIRAMLKAAVKYYYSQFDETDRAASDRALMLSVIAGEPVEFGRFELKE